VTRRSNALLFLALLSKFVIAVQYSSILIE